MKLNKIIALAAFSAFGHQASAQQTGEYVFDNKRPEKIEDKIVLIADTTKYRCPCTIFKFLGNDTVIVSNIEESKLKNLKQNINDAVPSNSETAIKNPLSLFGAMINDMNHLAATMKRKGSFEDKQYQNKQGLVLNFSDDLPSEEQEELNPGVRTKSYYIGY